MGVGMKLPPWLLSGWLQSAPMSSGLQTDISRLPPGPVDRLTKPLSEFLRIETTAGAVLLLFTILALALSNSPWAQQSSTFWETPLGFQAGSFEFVRSLRHWINDGLMTLFFFVVSLELKRELVLGELRDRRVAALPIAAAVGGMLAPAILYVLVAGEGPGAHGWGIVMATDTAFVIGCLALLGPGIPRSLRVFMLSLAVADDIGAILVVAIGYSGDLDWKMLGLGALGVAATLGVARLGVRGFPVYFLIGVLIWAALDASGIHGTVTGVVLGLLAPARRWVSDERLHAILDRVATSPADQHWSGDTEDRKSLQVAEVAAREALSPVERLEIALHPWVGFVIMPLFALANAGVALSFASVGDPITVAVFVGFVLGKPLGIILFCWLAVRANIAVRAADLNWGILAGGGMLAGIGFTMALFIANLALDESLIGAAKQGILYASVVSATAGVALLAWLGRKDRFR